MRRYSRRDQAAIYGAKLQILEADRLSNPKEHGGLDRLTAGVETDADGRPSALYRISEFASGQLAHAGDGMGAHPGA